MSEIYDQSLKARLTLDDDDRVRGINHVDEYWHAEASNPRTAAIDYLRGVSDRFDMVPIELAHAHQPVNFFEPDDRGTEVRHSHEKAMFDSTTEGFYQTHLNVPVWDAGLTVTVKHNPLRVVSAVNTTLSDIDAQLPPEDVIARWREIFQRAEVDQQSARLSSDDFQSELAPFVGDLLGGRAFKTSRSAAATKDRERARGARVISGRFFIYRYDPDARLLGGSKQLEEVVVRLADDSDSSAFQEATPPTLPLPPVDDSIKAGADYLVAEMVFNYPTPEFGNLNWRVLVELTTGSVLFLRALVANVDGLVFVADPVSESGAAANGPAATSATLNPFRDDVTLPNLDAPVGGTQSLTGSRVTISEQENPTVSSPTAATGNDFDFDARSNDFAAVNAYYHVDRFFGLVEDLGFVLSTYFDGTTFPVPVDHRGLAHPIDCPSGNCINAHCSGNGAGIDHLCYALADTGDTANPIGIAADWRVHLHELGGHGILHDHVGMANFGFAHSAGDSIAVIYTDPDSNAPDAGLLAPFIPAVTRRHDRPVATWAWNGPNDLGIGGPVDRAGYRAEQILSTTLFRAYQSIGGASTNLSRRQFAARYMVYLILRTVGTLTPMTNPANATAFANSLIATDLLNWTSEGVDGGAYGKVIRWAFEKQGLYQPGTPAAQSVTTEGDPPAVDVYFEDGRGGEYEFLNAHWATTTVWNRLADDSGTSHQPPVLGATNYAYIKIKNRGTQQASNVVVKGYHTKPSAGLLWPDDFEAFTTAQISAGTLNPNNTEEKTVGPFEWTPNINAYGHDCMLMVVSATDDPSNVDNFTAGETIPLWRLVPNDNNVIQRNVNPVPGGGGTGGLLAGLSGFPLWVRNPNPARAVIDVDVKLPPLLAERGWKLALRGQSGHRFRLASREQVQLQLDLVPGADFEAEEVEAAEDRDIVIQLLADGGPIGGMTYRLDPRMKRPANPLDGRPGDKHERCRLHAGRLLDCLDLHGHDVAKVKVKKITVDISMEDECC